MVPILIIGLVTSLLYRNSMTNKINEVVDSNTLQSTQMISERLVTYRNSLYQVVTDQNIVNLADRLEDASTELDRAYGQQNLRFALSEYINIKSYCTALTFLYNSDYVTYDRTADDFVTIWHNDHYRKLFLGLCNPGINTVVYVSGVDISLSANDVASKSVYLIYPLRDKATNRYLGVIVLSLQNEIFDTSMQNSQIKSNDIQGIRSAVISSQKKVVFPTLQSKSDTEELSDTIWNSPNILTHEISDSKWYFVTALDTKILFSEVDNMQRWFILITVAACLLFLLLLLYTANRMERSIVRIAEGIENYVPGRKGISIGGKQKDEFSILIRRFNEMTQRNNRLIDELKKRNVQIAEETDKHRKAELKALEAQINPHFLYNVLDSINWIAIGNGEMEISRMLTSLGSIMRYSATNIDLVVAFQAEIEWMKEYVFLQQERYGNAFTFECEADENTMAFPIYKMLLQPLAENAIQHGFEGIHSGGVLHLTAQLLNGERLKICVADNGCGIEAETLRKIRGQIDGSISIDGNAIGVSNVLNRTRMYYGTEASIKIESEIGKGTKVTLILPRCGEGEEIQ
ncbi:sensor histidine kinase [Caproicibacter fermentans]|nr:histidine kinase [Caproicibacter fermentans]